MPQTNNSKSDNVIFRRTQCFDDLSKTIGPLASFQCDPRRGKIIPCHWRGRWKEGLISKVGKQRQTEETYPVTSSLPVSTGVASARPPVSEHRRKPLFTQSKPNKDNSTESGTVHTSTRQRVYCWDTTPRLLILISLSEFSNFISGISLSDGFCSEIVLRWLESMLPCLYKTLITGN